VAKLESIPLTLLGGFAIGVAQQLILRYIHGNLGTQLQPAVPFIVLLGALFLPIKWPDAPDRPPPPPKRTPKPASFQTRAFRVGLIGLAMVVPALFATPEWQGRISAVPSMALIFLSLVLLSGYAGQISLAQAAFAGFGGFIAAHMVADHGWPMLLAASFGALVTIPLGALLAFRATRLSPLFLGFATLAFGALMEQLAFSNVHFTGGFGGVPIGRPSWASGALAYYFFTLLVFGVFALAVTNIRKGKTGLALAAMRDSPVGVASLGASVARLKFVAFCVSAFIAGLGGALYSASIGLAAPTSFFELQSLLILALAVIGGIGTWTGALVGAVLFLLFQPVFDLPLVHNNFIAEHVFHGQLPNQLPVYFGLGAIGLAQNPNGIVEQIREGTARAGELFARVRTLGRKPAAPTEAPDVEPAVVETAPTGGGGPVSFPQGRLFHRPDCVMTVGKEAGTEVAGHTDGLKPCPVCEPEPVART
jgi:ABC-type branched-subunit amino acid transport system permease subunit